MRLSSTYRLSCRVVQQWQSVALPAQWHSHVSSRRLCSSASRNWPNNRVCDVGTFSLCMLKLRKWNNPFCQGIGVRITFSYSKADLWPGNPFSAQYMRGWPLSFLYGSGKFPGHLLLVKISLAIWEWVIYECLNVVQFYYITVILSLLLLFGITIDIQAAKCKEVHT